MATAVQGKVPAHKGPVNHEVESDDDVDEAMGEMSLQETMDDLKNRQKVKQQIQNTATRQREELAEIIPKFIANFQIYKLSITRVYFLKTH